MTAWKKLNFIHQLILAVTLLQKKNPEQSRKTSQTINTISTIRLVKHYINKTLALIWHSKLINKQKHNERFVYSYTLFLLHFKIMSLLTFLKETKYPQLCFGNVNTMK